MNEQLNTALVTITSAALTVMSTGIWFINLNFQWLQILVAPKMYLIEYAATLVK